MHFGMKHFLCFGFLRLTLVARLVSVVVAQPENGGYVVADDVRAVAHLLIDESNEALLYAGLGSSAAFNASGTGWSGTLDDWISMANVNVSKDVPEGRFYWKSLLPAISSSVYGYRISSASPGTNAVRLRAAILYAAEGSNAAAHTSFAENATYTLQYDMQFRFDITKMHTGPGLQHFAMVAVAPPVVDGEGNLFAAPAALAGSHASGLPPPGDAHNGYNFTKFDGESDFRGTGPVSAGFVLGPTFYCETPKCCDRTTPEYGDWPDYLPVNVGAFAPNPPEKCDWRRSDGSDRDGFVAYGASAAPPEHELAIDNNGLFSSWYTVTIILLPPGYIVGVELPLRAYNFSFARFGENGQAGAMTHPQTFVGLPPAAAGLGMGFAAVRGTTYFRNVTVRKTLPLETLRTLAASQTQPPAVTTRAATSASAGDTAISTTHHHAEQNTSILTNVTGTNGTQPGRQQQPQQQEQHQRDVAEGAFFVTAVVLLAGACACSVISLSRAYKARSALLHERRSFIDNDALAAEAAAESPPLQQQQQQQQQQQHGRARRASKSYARSKSVSGGEEGDVAMAVLRKNKEQKEK